MITEDPPFMSQSRVKQHGGRSTWYVTYSFSVTSFEGTKTVDISALSSIRLSWYTYIAIRTLGVLVVTVLAAVGVVGDGAGSTHGKFQGLLRSRRWRRRGVLCGRGYGGHWSRRIWNNVIRVNIICSISLRVSVLSGLSSGQQSGQGKQSQLHAGVVSS